MSKADDYRTKAIGFEAEARAELDPERKSDLAWLVKSYLRLAEHADNIEARDAIHATSPPSQVQQPQQQQQSKFETDDKVPPETE